MKKVKMGPQALVFPMPCVLVGGKGSNAKTSFATIAWAGIVNSSPPMIGVGVRKSRFTHSLITESGEFSVNVPSSDQAAETDFCGIRSGKDVNKAEICKFTVFYGELQSAPLIEECPLNLECRIVKTVELPSHDYFIGEIVESHLNENLKTDGPHKAAKISPLVFMGSHYSRTVGDLGKAFSVGKTLSNS